MVGTVWAIFVPALLHVVLAPAYGVVVAHLPRQHAHNVLDIHIPVDIILDNQGALDVVVDDVSPDVRVGSPDTQRWGPGHIVVSDMGRHGFRVDLVCSDLQRLISIGFGGRVLCVIRQESW